MHASEQADQPSSEATRANPSAALAWARGLAGAAAGGALGHFAFGWLLNSGVLGYRLYAIALPGALLGLGAGLASGRKSVPLGILCAVLAVGLGVLTEWRFLPFVDDKSLSFFLANVNQLTGMTHVMIGLGGLMGLWFGVGRGRAR